MFIADILYNNSKTYGQFSQGGVNSYKDTGLKLEKSLIDFQSERNASKG